MHKPRSLVLPDLKKGNMSMSEHSRRTVLKRIGGASLLPFAMPALTEQQCLRGMVHPPVASTPRSQARPADVEVPAAMVVT